MYVIKRDGRQEAVFFDKITSRIRKLCYGLSTLVEAEKVTQKVGCSCCSSCSAAWHKDPIEMKAELTPALCIVGVFGCVQGCDHHRA